jgi:excisionase family DNA binding protein
MTEFSASEPPPLSVPKLAQRWECSEGLIYKLIREKQLIAFRPGSLIRIRLAEVERFECQQQNHMPSRNSGTGSPSSGGKKTQKRGNGDGDGGSSTPKIGRAPRRKRAACGPQATIVHGPWAGS